MTYVAFIWIQQTGHNSQYSARTSRDRSSARANTVVSTLSNKLEESDAIRRESLGGWYADLKDVLRDDFLNGTITVPKDVPSLSAFRRPVKQQTIDNQYELDLNVDNKEAALQSATLSPGLSFVIVGPTGIGKTTRVPSLLCGIQPSFRILVVEPTLLQAVQAYHFSEKSGRAAGILVDRDSVVRPGEPTFCSSRTLLARLVSDPSFLVSIQLVILDESHIESAENVDLPQIIKCRYSHLILLYATATPSLSHSTAEVGNRSQGSFAKSVIYDSLWPPGCSR
ncbi:hypothetical protein BD408DRAFT_438553 [Parasitella parasitica]|nr:hypothetical protein BD408DRAFT_438553 [Parasitella parasitica]